MNRSTGAQLINSKLFKYIDFACKLSKFYDQLLADRDWPVSLPHGPEGLTELAQQLHFYNSSLWIEEDQARRVSVPDAEIVKNKRLIDGFNQLRNNHIELIDDLILSSAPEPDLNFGLIHRNSETAGSMFDRISILSLKIFHMSKQTLRTDVDDSHRSRALAKVIALEEQRTDLTESLGWLMKGVSEGRVYFKMYRQFKMYNDPQLNPVLVAESSKAN